MKRIGILTLGGDTPALNATIADTVVRANQVPDEWVRVNDAAVKRGYGYKHISATETFDLDQMVNYLETEPA
jgi:6-phosphofructokinase